jgi:hypothetical protein
MQVFQLFGELIALPPNAIRIECKDLEGPVNFRGHFFQEV